MFSKSHEPDTLPPSMTHRYAIGTRQFYRRATPSERSCAVGGWQLQTYDDRLAAAQRMTASRPYNPLLTSWIMAAYSGVREAQEVNVRS